jgi:3-dehydroquinate synthase
MHASMGTEGGRRISPGILHFEFCISLSVLYNRVMPDVPVNLADASYTIRIEPGLLARAGIELRSVSRAARAIVITDNNVGLLHLPALTKSLREAGFELIVATLTPGEQHKTLPDLLPVYDTILSARIERSTPLLALGGGIVGDMAGFVAATVLRGVPFVQIPTTLLAMVDSSVGGKTGVNHSAGKNLIGVFHQPVRVLADPQVLVTLPRRELIDGLAECIKHQVIRDAEGFTALEKNLDAILNLDLPCLTETIAQNVRIKTQVVEADPLENGERAHLNFGHTFGHAIEKASNHAYSHGQAVALGMVAATWLAVDLQMLDTSSGKRIIALIKRAGLPASGLQLTSTDVLHAMQFDKKVIGGQLRLILPDRIGHVVIREDVRTDAILRAIDRLNGDN